MESTGGPPRGRAAWLPLAVLLAVAAPPDPAGGQGLDVGEVPLADVLEVLVLDGDLVAIDARGGGQVVTPLRRAEMVRWTGARGVVGAVLTDQRLLAVANVSASWQTTRWHRGELPPEDVILGERVAVLATSRRAIGFDGGSGNLVESRLGPGERVLTTRAGANVAVVITDRRALGLSPYVGGFFAVTLALDDPLRDVSIRANLVTLTTDHRLLIFRAPTGTWEERRRELH